MALNGYGFHCGDQLQVEDDLGKWRTVRVELSCGVWYAVGSNYHARSLIGRRARPLNYHQVGQA